MAAEPQLKLTPEELEKMAKLAKRRGFADLTAYMRQLVKSDAEQHGEAAPVAETDDIDPVESFRRGWEDVQAGRVYPIEELWNHLKNVE